MGGVFRILAWEESRLQVVSAPGRLKAGLHTAALESAPNRQPGKAALHSDTPGDPGTGDGAAEVAFPGNRAGLRKSAVEDAAVKQEDKNCNSGGAPAFHG